MSDIKFNLEGLKNPSRVNKKALILVSCGSFNPVTFMHLRLFEASRDHLKLIHGIEVLGGYISPVNDAYKKPGLISSEDRCKMIELALKTSNWVKLDRWEANQSEYKTTIKVLKHFEEELSEFYKESVGEVRVSLLCGADLLESMVRAEIWSVKDVEYIIGHHGMVVFEREGIDLQKLISGNEIFSKLSENIFTVPSLINNDVSATKIREFIRKGYSTRYTIVSSNWERCSTILSSCR